MAKPRGPQRRIALLVEGETEQYVKLFLHRWLNRQLPMDRRIGLRVVRCHGVGNYLRELAQRVNLAISRDRADFVFGLVDLYGLPIDMSRCSTIEEKVSLARQIISGRINKPQRKFFRQHFAVHEIEAWLLAYPDQWPQAIRDQVRARPPEQVNFDKPPSKLLGELLGGYKKIVHAKRIFSSVDAQTAIDVCHNCGPLPMNCFKSRQN